MESRLTQLRSGPVIRKQDEKPISPMLLIGLGGTGKEVLLRFRRLVVERYGSLDALPSVQCRHFDTDQTLAAKTIYDNQDDPFHDKVKFTEAETQALCVPGGIQQYVLHIDRYAHIKAWLQARGSFAALGELGEGAGQVRMASRLGFYHNFARIVSLLTSARTRLASPDVAKRVAELGFDFNANDLNIFIVASLAGGTGSGTFLDFGFLTRKIFPEATRVAILFMPSLFAGYAGGERVKANGYAALMELNHYAFGNAFDANWDGQKKEMLPPPPFSYTYLIDALNQDGFNVGSNGQEYTLYQMMAESLFLEYWEGKLAALKRATRVNLIQYTQDAYYHNYWEPPGAAEEHSRRIEGDTYPTRFGSQGLGMIYFPADRVHNACAAMLAKRIVERWESRGTEDPVRCLFRDFLMKKRVPLTQLSFYEGITRFDLDEALLAERQGETFLDRFRNETQQWKSLALSSPLGNKAQTLRQVMGTFDSYMGDEDSPHPTNWGPYVRALEANMDRHLAALLGREGSLERAAGELTEDDRFGVSCTLEMLLQLKNLLQKGGVNDIFKYRPYFDDMLRHYTQETQVRRGKVEQLTLDMEREESHWHLFGRRDVIRRQIELLAGTPEEPGHLFEYMKARFLRQVAKRGLLTVDRVDEYLGKPEKTGQGMLGRYFNILGGFGELKDRFDQRLAYFSREKAYPHAMNLFRPGDTERWYQAWTNTPQHSESACVENLSAELLRDVFHVDSPSRALRIIQSTPALEIEDAMLARCKRLFSGSPNQPSALELLMDPERFNDLQRHNVVQQALKMSRFWLKMAVAGLEHVGGAKVSDGQKPMFIGVDSTSPALRSAFENMLGKFKMDASCQTVDVGEKNRFAIIFYTELQGVPLFNPESVIAISGLKEAYVRHYTAPDAAKHLDLHTDRDRFKFSDLIPKTDAEVDRYRKAVQAFVLGRITGLFKAAGDDEETTFAYEYDEDFITQRRLLGTEGDAIYRLANPRGADALRERITKDVENRLAILQQAGRLDVYLLLLEFYQKMVYPTRDDREGDIEFTRLTPQHAELKQEESRVYKQLSGDPESQKRLNNAYLALRGTAAGKPLSREEFQVALAPYTQACGKFVIPVPDGFGVLHLTAFPAPVVDIQKFVTAAEKARPVSAQGAPLLPPPQRETRPCPVCRKPIPIRAIFCTQDCRREVSEHTSCLNPNCGDRRVPRDLAICPTCGHPQVRAEILVCESCFTGEGERGTPCPVCGHPIGEATTAEPSRAPSPGKALLQAPPAPPGSIGDFRVVSPPSDEAAGKASPGLGQTGEIPVIPLSALEAASQSAPGIIPDARADEPAAAGVRLVECPSCFEFTPAGLPCRVCGAKPQTN